MEEKIQKIEKEISVIKERNLRVEADKAWETSNFRIFSITLITYIVASFVLYFIGAKNFLLSALVPTAGYFLSVQSLPAIKRWWIENFLRGKGKGPTNQ
ncbi:MAG: hypothetical protein A3G46_00935 [Candidatus Zambryskibacteria bacterium RIFCSPLOWO2_12_FULL_39_16]|uniref:Uncharacterized protein n=1 Tax=Candidatus Zambryskibacteria bacterium RIFCSPLOWO2_12_FULL_39_16 TaxID=1802775 RepID=A0A1G2UT25_9BACT|nr:MAG: hypothetical protein A3G46_00935 [Candidatus Zambryskibacteria bacterium RIFCSPLOWO2_12_FULL_39_16]